GADGDDALSLTGGVPGGAARLEGGGGDDNFAITYPVGWGTLEVDGGAGRNSLAVALTDADETVTLNPTSVQVAGALTTRFSNVAAVALDTRGGDDVVTVPGTIAGGTRIDTGLGADTITVEATQGELTVSAGDGADTVNVRRTSAALTIHAGLGDDSVN